MIVQTVTSAGQFSDEFHAYNRGDQFSYEALQAMYVWFEEFSEDSGQPFELDVIGICCEFTEYASLEDLQCDYDHIESLENLYDHTSVIELDSGALVIQQF